MLHVSRESSFISNQFLVLNLDGLFGVLAKKKLLVLDFPLLYYHINLGLFFWRYCLGDMVLLYQILYFMFHFQLFLSCSVVNFLILLLFYQQFIVNQNRQLLLLFFELLFWNSFKCICSRVFRTIKNILTLFTA